MSESRLRITDQILRVLLITGLIGHASVADEPGLEIRWNKRMLTISGSSLPGPVEIHYLEAYCRAGSTDREWGQTVIRHRSTLVEGKNDGKQIQIEDRLDDGVVVRHTITTGTDVVDFLMVATNPTQVASAVDWAQPCVRVDQFTGCDRKESRELYPPYIRQSFLFFAGKPAPMPTRPWADQARYTPGQVYCPPAVNRNDVNPRPLSKLVPSNALVGCFSADKKQLMAIAFVPCQEIFQGVITCLHSDPRIGGLKPGQTKRIRGKIYFMGSDLDKLTERYKRDFPEDGFRK